MYECWHDYVKPRYDEDVRLRYMDTDSFIVYIKKMLFIKILQKTLKLDLYFKLWTR